MIKVVVNAQARVLFVAKGANVEVPSGAGVIEVGAYEEIDPYIDYLKAQAGAPDFWLGNVVVNEFGSFFNYINDPLPTPERDARRVARAETDIAAIPNYAAWTAEQALAQFAADITNPLAAATTLAEVKAVVGRMAQLEGAILRMTIAMRNRLWPHLEEGG